MKAFLRSGFLALAVMALAVPANAGPFEDGVAAYQRGDYAMAMRLWLPLAEQGNARAQYILGLNYAKGQGVPQDYAEAANWYRKAAEQGDADAQYNLGTMYRDGQGVPQDWAEAAKWWRMAAEQGDAGAQYNLAHILLLEAVARESQDRTEAIKWLRMAADTGRIADAQAALGSHYLYGVGVPKDFVLAYPCQRHRPPVSAQCFATTGCGPGRGLQRDVLLTATA